MQDIDVGMIWSFLVASVVWQLLVIEIVREERHNGSLLQLKDGRVETFSVSAGAGLAYWFTLMFLFDPLFAALEAMDQQALQALIITGSAIGALVFAECVTQAAARLLFKDVTFATVLDVVQLRH